MRDTQDEPLARLFNAADDNEADVIEQVAIKAGLLWRCPDEGCRYNNDEQDKVCGSCGKKRPK